jgi:hypothetical protein
MTIGVLVEAERFVAERVFLAGESGAGRIGDGDGLWICWRAECFERTLGGVILLSDVVSSHISNGMRLTSQEQTAK